MAKAATAEKPGTALAAVVRSCGNCAAWRPKKNQLDMVFGGCARGGTTTSHYGETVYHHYTTDLQSCSAWEGK